MKALYKTSVSAGARLAHRGGAAHAASAAAASRRAARPLAPRQARSIPPPRAPPAAPPRTPRPRPRAAPVAAAAAAASAADGFGAHGGLPAARLRGALARVAAFVESQYLPIALVSALALGAAYPGPGLEAAKLHVPALATFGIFTVQGLQLRRREAAAALTMRREIAYGLAAILLVTPLLGLLVAQLPLQPRPLAFGLGVVCAVPTALACGVAFVQQLGGNVSLALLLTVASNILGIFTMPFVLPHVMAAASIAPQAAAGAGAAVLEPLPFMMQLCQTILLPTAIGACIRGFVPGAAAAIDARRKLMSYLNAAMLASVPWMQISKTASQSMAVDAAGVAATAAAAVGVHVLFLLVNTAACRLLRLGGPDPAAARAARRAVIIASSVKTLPVAVTVLTKLGPLLGEAAVGVAMLPVVLYQLVQIMWESVMVSRWLAGDRAEEGRRAPGGGGGCGCA
ncbi:hypothetical protein Rsub_09844 [Raphidocelis subcapitata]|uniref:Bile acid:sodium symporter n=1 Tax=Raphidocelis subcapitata TaxID=307507 RepID=A0A2V0PC45_9CHLO|nr:hypothetical protein Rsub_09844 [Raphidocelis subcapitata]|eukprot:GBF96502.1 hypothetical protein Rsub_09844 [Raphidocelis subcapitata]